MPTPEEKREIIGKIPEEGAFKYESYGAQFRFTEDDLQAALDKTFQGKTPPKEGGQSATILMGAQGSGKSFFAQEGYNRLPEDKRKNVIYVSYDETGAIFLIPEYLEALKQHVPDFDPRNPHKPVSDTTLDIRRSLWEQYRPFSQKIRERVLKRGLAEGYSVIIDTTSSSKGTLKLIEALRKLEIPQIQIAGMFAPFPISRHRVEERVRPETPHDLILKRIGVLEMIPLLCTEVDEFAFGYNENEGYEPRHAFTYQHGQPTTVNPNVVGKIQRALRTDRQEIIRYIAEITKGGPIQELEGALEKYDAAWRPLHAFLERLANKTLDLEDLGRKL